MADRLQGERTLTAVPRRRTRSFAAATLGLAALAAAATLGLAALAAAAGGRAQAGAAHAVAVQITAADCARLAPVAASGASTYVPGRDAHGRPVAPAEIAADPEAAAGADLLAAARLELEWSGANWRARPRRSGAAPTLVLGSIGFDAAGRPHLNGTPLSTADRARLAAACAQAGGTTPP